MHAIATAFRAARQSQWRRASGHTMLATGRANSNSAAPQTLGDVSAIFKGADTTTAEDPIRNAETADPAVLPAYIDNPLIKGDIKFRGFKAGKFVNPFEYTQKERSKVRPTFKSPLLGPSAAESRKTDILYQLDIDPLHECQNSSLMSHFLSDMGKIRPRAQTKLTWKNQRRLGKAVRRAKMMGIIPVLSRRPLTYGTMFY